MFDAQSVYGIQPQIPGATAGVQKPTAGLGLSGEDFEGWKTLIDPHNPLFVLLLVLGVTFGAAGVSGSAKAGPLKGSLSLGDSD